MHFLTTLLYFSLDGDSAELACSQSVPYSKRFCLSSTQLGSTENAFCAQDHLPTFLSACGCVSQQMDFYPKIAIFSGYHRPLLLRGVSAQQLSTITLKANIKRAYENKAHFPFHIYLSNEEKSIESPS